MRLIDADEFLKTNGFLFEDKNSLEKRNALATPILLSEFLDMIDDAPTIAPAETGGEGAWIPLVWKESKGLEEDGFPKGVMITWSDMPMPGDEILISSNRNGFVDADIALEDDEGCYLDSGLDWEEVDAWMPLPEPYTADKERTND